jgi:pantothenate kinase-related protein Tda10
MINKVKVKLQKNKQGIPKLFHGHESQNRCIFISGSQGSGKSQLTIDIIKKQANKKKTHIFWISSLVNGIQSLDDKVNDLAENYMV